MPSFNTRFDIGAEVETSSGRVGAVKALYIGSDRAVSCVVEFSKTDGDVTTYDDATLPESALRDPNAKPEPEQAE